MRIDATARILSGIVLIGLVPSYVSAQSSIPDVRGVYVWTPLDAHHGSPAAQPYDSALSKSGVDGILLLGLWNQIEPSMGQYDWKSLDQWLSYAVSAHKEVTLAIRAGDGIPQWLFLSPPAGAGAARLVFTISPHEGKTNVCVPDTIAPPWDPAYLSRWDSLLTALSAHLRSKGTYDAVTALRLTGINRTSDELRLPAETPISTGLPCVSDAISIWQSAGYRPSLLLHAWDAITSAFQTNFPDKTFSVAIIPNPPQIPFPTIAEDGSLIAGNPPDQSMPLLTLAAERFPGRLVVQFNFLLNGTPANIAVIQAAQRLGTMAAFQSNNFYSLSNGGAACGGTPANPDSCTAPAYLEQLETGIFPLGKEYSLRAQYLELWQTDVNKFPDDILQAHLELLSSSQASSTTLNLGAPVQLFHTGQLNMTYVPDMHLAMVQQPDSTYRVFISGVIGKGGNGSTGLLTTKDFLTYKPGIGSATDAIPVLMPSCDSSAACEDNFDAGYAGANTVFPSRNGRDLMVIYHGETRTFGSTTNAHTPMFAEVGLARSTDNGISWSREGAIISGSDPKPSVDPTSDVNGTPEPGAVVAGNFIYTFYPYFPTAGDSDAGPSTIQVARASVDSDGAPGTWTKFYDTSFGAQPGLGGYGSQVVPAVGPSVGARQPWVAYSEYLRAYVLVFVTRFGWFFSTSTDLVTWALPKQFFFPTDTLFTPGKENDENVVLVTPGNPPQVIGQSGYVLYASTPSFGFGTGSSVSHELWMRPFSFDAPVTAIEGGPIAAPSSTKLEQNYPNPFNPSTTIQYTIEGTRGQGLGVSDVRLSIYDVLGREVARLVNARQAPGTYEVKFDGSQLASGVYFCHMTVGSFTQVRRMILAK